jgi:tRNA(Ile2) C34 agmatinyltransferase TiaS
MPTQTQRLIRRNPQVVYRELGDGSAVLLNLESSQYHGLNRIGRLVWELLERPTPVGLLAERVRASVADAPAELERETAAFVESLLSRDLVLEEEGRVIADERTAL